MFNMTSVWGVNNGGGSELCYYDEKSPDSVVLDPPSD